MCPMLLLCTLNCVNVCVGSSFRWWREIFLSFFSTSATIRFQRFLQEHSISAYGRQKRAETTWVHTHKHTCMRTQEFQNIFSEWQTQTWKWDFPPALLTQSGASIINGNWVIDRPGSFTAVGTQLTYQRPNEIRSRSGESITSPGPLTEDLHLYVRFNNLTQTAA